MAWVNESRQVSVFTKSINGVACTRPKLALRSVLSPSFAAFVQPPSTLSAAKPKKNVRVVFIFRIWTLPAAGLALKDAASMRGIAASCVRNQVHDI